MSRDGKYMHIIDLEKKPLFAIILSSFGGFLGGMFTFIAVVISLKEFLINKRKNGSHKFLELINEMFCLCRQPWRVHLIQLRMI